MHHFLRLNSDYVLAVPFRNGNAEELGRRSDISAALREKSITAVDDVFGQRPLPLWIRMGEMIRILAPTRSPFFH